MNLPDLVSAASDAFRDHRGLGKYIDLDPSEASPRKLVEFFKKKKGILAFACHEGHMIGMAALSVMPKEITNPDDRDHALLRYAAVSMGYRNHGVGTQLIQDLICSARNERHASHMDILHRRSWVNATGLYNRFGFKRRLTVVGDAELYTLDLGPIQIPAIPSAH